MVRKVIGSGFTWKIRPRDTETNRQMIMKTIEQELRGNNGLFPKEGDVFVEPDQGVKLPTV